MTEKNTVLAKIGLTAALTVLVQMFLPWWSVAIAAFAAEQIGRNRPTWSFYAGFYGVAIVWVIYAFVIDYRNSHLLSHRMVKMFMLPDSPVLMLILAGLIGGVTAGLAALSGNYFKVFYQKNEPA